MGHGPNRPDTCHSSAGGLCPIFVSKHLSARDKYCGCACICGMIRLALVHGDENNPFRKGLNAMQFHNLSHKISMEKQTGSLENVSMGGQQRLDIDIQAMMKQTFMELGDCGQG